MSTCFLYFSPAGSVFDRVLLKSTYLPSSLSDYFNFYTKWTRKKYKNLNKSRHFEIFLFYFCQSCIYRIRSTAEWNPPEPRWTVTYWLECSFWWLWYHVYSKFLYHDYVRVCVMCSILTVRKRGLITFTFGFLPEGWTGELFSCMYFYNPAFFRPCTHLKNFSYWLIIFAPSHFYTTFKICWMK